MHPTRFVCWVICFQVATFDDIKAGYEPKTEELKALVYRYIVDHTMEAEQKCVATQMSAERGVKIYGERAIKALLKDFAQLNEMDTFKLPHVPSLSTEQQMLALRLIDLSKENRDGNLKGRTCVDGRPQMKNISKEEAASPTFSNKALMACMVISAHEGREVATAGIRGGYLHADMDDLLDTHSTSYIIRTEALGLLT